ncbi:XRE family transcriptional regulator [Nocardia higoensis]|uniref:XRE family transcriptional regulator n=1 Tax=Nocardia higoensis TaxID=228599 RepID=UPI0012F6F839|nr:XRE family transcriptional regulator [Nocardia higoensis]
MRRRQRVSNSKLQQLIRQAGLTQDGLARRVNARIDQITGTPGRYTDETIRRYLCGERTWPDPKYREAFRHVLGVDSDHQLGFFDQRAAHAPLRAGVEADPLHRPDSLRAAGGVTAAVTAQAALADLVEITEPTPIPARVGKVEIAQILDTARVFDTWDNTYGGVLVREAVAAQLRYAVALLDARCSASNRAELFSAVGFLANTSAWMAFDSHAHDDARRMQRLALRCAEEASDVHLRAEVLSCMARQEIWCGDPDAGLTLTELGLVRADRLTPTERASLRVIRARALAQLHRVEEAVRAVGEADESFSNRSPGDDAFFMAYYDDAQLGGDTGHALYDMALHGRFVGEARARLQTAVSGFGDIYVRSRALAHLKLASLVMATGDPHEATVIGHAAIDEAAHVRSRRMGVYLRELDSLAAAHRSVDGVTGLRRRLAAAAM